MLLYDSDPVFQNWFMLLMVYSYCYMADCSGKNPSDVPLVGTVSVPANLAGFAAEELVFSSSESEKPLWISMPCLMIGLAFITWFISNTKRIYREKQRVFEAERRKVIERYEFASKVCTAIAEAERAKFFPPKTRSKSSVSRKRSKIKRRVPRGRWLSMLWNKLQKTYRLKDGMKTFGRFHFTDNNDDTYSSIYVSDDDASSIPCIREYLPGATTALKPKFHSTDTETCSDTSTGAEFLSNDVNEAIIHYQVSREKSEVQNKSLSVFPDTPYLSSNRVNIDTTCNQVSEDSFELSSLLCITDFQNPREEITNRHLLLAGSMPGQRLSAMDSGYQDVDDSSGSSLSPVVERKAREVLREIEKYSRFKDSQLPAMIMKSQSQIKSEISAIKLGFHLPVAEVEFSPSQLYDCPELQNARKTLLHVRSQIENIKGEIESSEKNAADLSRRSQKEQADPLRRMKVSLAWEHTHAERISKIVNDIVYRVKSAMQMRFHGMMFTNRDVILTSESLCYDCATRRHDRFFIDGLDGCEAVKKKLLTATNGFDENCTVVRVINSWYNALELDKSDSTKSKADKLDILRKRVLKELYLKRYYERGQLISQTYLTVNPNMHEFVHTSPQASIPLVE